MVWWRGFLDVQVATPARQSPPKGEIPASSLTRGGGLKRFCSELISSLRKTATSELASPEDLGPRRPDASGYTWWRGGGLHSHSDLLSPPLGGNPSRGSPGKIEGRKQRCFRDRPEWRLLVYHTYCSSTLNTARTPVDVAGVEPALGPLNGHILVGGRTPFC